MAKKKALLLEDVYRSRQCKNFQKNPNFGEEPPNAKMDEMVVAKAVDELQASGGDCPIVTMYDKDKRIGAVVHIDAEHAGGDYHTDLFDKLLETFDLPLDSKVHIIIDLQGIGKPLAARTAWLNQIRTDLEGRGFEDIETCTNSEGKYVTLNAAEGTLVVTNTDEHELLNVNLASG